MTTVSVYDRLPLFEAVGMWVSGNYALVPRAEVYPPNQTVEQVEPAERAGFPGFPVGRRDRGAALSEVSERGLRRDDRGRRRRVRASCSRRIRSAIDGTQVTDFASLQAALKNTRPGPVVRSPSLRGAKSVDAKVTLQANASVGKQGFLGIGAVERPKAPFDDLHLAGQHRWPVGRPDVHARHHSTSSPPGA